MLVSPSDSLKPFDCWNHNIIALTISIFLNENPFTVTDLRTGAAGAVALKYTTREDDNIIGFIGTGAIARNMARGAASVRKNFTGVAYGLDAEGSKAFAEEMSSELGIPFKVASSSEELCNECNVIYTQTTGSNFVLKLEHLRKGTTIIASGSDQPTKQELPNDVLQSTNKYIADLTKQTSRVGELRGAIEANMMTTDDVYCELGELVNGTKVGRENDQELIVVDLTGTGGMSITAVFLLFFHLNFYLFNLIIILFRSYFLQLKTPPLDR